MDVYFEQSVAGDRGSREQLLYSLHLAGIAALALIALVSLTNIFGYVGEDVGFNWGALAILVAAAALMAVLIRRKDMVYREYDYILWNSELEVSVIYNRKRRKKLATIHLGQVTAWGPAPALANRMQGAAKSDWCPHAEAAWCLIYSEQNGTKAVLLELNEGMCAQLRSSSSAMRSAEVRT